MNLYITLHLENDDDLFSKDGEWLLYNIKINEDLIKEK
jgi:hypothetical protein